ncbi:MAG: hypothetical protein AYK23_03300 [Candidatus Proteinoplasmatales archaeon SG8-5]|nr:MAG: hypothetical protein AYK23_03300 [Candidatus Proteinoplasmatales archaeon SG8-5]
MNANLTPENTMSVNVTSPNGGEIWKGGDPHTITWNMENDWYPDNDILVEIYCCYIGSSGPWMHIDTVVGLESYTWNSVPPVDYTNCYIRVNCTDPDFLSTEDISDGPFKIDSTPPAPASNVRAELDGLGVRIHWDHTPSPDLDHYEVYWRMNAFNPTGNSYASSINAGNNTTAFHANVGSENPQRYFYQIRTFDKVGHETRTTIQAGKYGKTLSTFTHPDGWFLCGLPLEVSNNSVENLMQSIDGDFHVMVYRNHVWLHYCTYWPPQLNTLHETYQGEGFWLNVFNNDRLAIAGTVTDVMISLETGWNLVAFPYTGPMSVSALLPIIPGASQIMISDPSSPYNIKIATGSEILNPLDGFWVYVNFDTVWPAVNY